MTQAEYRANLRTFPMAELLKELRRVREGMAALNRRSRWCWRELTDDWQARQILAEIGSRQLTLLEDQGTSE